jgi:hypothetical protein
VRPNAPAARALWRFFAVLLVASPLLLPPGRPAAAAPCDPLVTNPIACENTLVGSPASEWDVAGSGDPAIQGFATDVSVNRGGTIQFKVHTPATAYRFDIYRLGYYGGAGARKVATVQPSVALPQVQPSCLRDAATLLTDCGNWRVSGSWAVPSDAVSGVYLAKLVGLAGVTGSSHIYFVVRDDASTAPLVYQTADTTWQAYNNYGGHSLYGFNSSNNARAYKVSFNRPLNTRGSNEITAFFASEYPMLRWLERNGYDVSYISGVDTDRAGSRLLNHRAFLSVGHDEYWSGAQRANVEAARDAGVHLAFLSGNEVFWKTRYENSIDASGTPYRTLVSYKETHANAKIDPSPEWTGTWRDPRFSPPADGGRPENALTGQLFVSQEFATAIDVPYEDGRMRLWRNTPLARMSPGQVTRLATNTLGFEADEDRDNGSRPPGLFRLSTTTYAATTLVDHGNNYSDGAATHHLTMYRAPSRALVFAAGTIQWSWGLDEVHDSGSYGPSPQDPTMQQAMVNLLADMGVQPGTLQANLAPATASADVAAPTSVVAFPANGASVAPNSDVVVSGTATDAGGGVVAGVEVSTDGGSTWHPAVGRQSWTYRWKAPGAGTAVIRTRAVDDSGNLEVPSSGVTVGVQSTAACPCSIWGASAVPSTAASADTSSVELGVKFRSDVAGAISAIRFYKGGTNAGPHVGNLWSAAGALLGRATFAGESASGWQQATFATPVAIAANTTYVASYFAPSGHYAFDPGYFAGAGIVSGTLRALQDGADGPNGLYRYGATTAFPTSSYNASNYWVDVVFVPAGAPTDGQPPSLAVTAPAPNSTVSGTVTVSASASDDVGVVGVQFRLDGANLGAEVTAAPYAIAWDTTRAADGAHTLSAVARDAAGNSATSTGVTVTVGNAAATRTATSTPTRTPSPTGTPTRTPSPLATPTWTPSPIGTSTPTRTPSPVQTSTPTRTPTTAPDTAAPAISGVGESDLTSTGATISWTTDEPSDTQVEYGRTPAYGSSTTLATERVTAHSQDLTGLSANTVYHYRVKSRDPAGNLAVSADFTFKTRR